MKFFNFFGKKQNLNKIENLPDLIKKFNRNELTAYKNKIKIEEPTKDPLYLRIKPEEFDYINLYYKELPVYKKYFIFPIKKFLSSNLRLSIRNLRFEKEIYRPNPEFREMYFGTQPEKFKITYSALLVLILFFAYLLGYTWARLKYDIYTRRIMYCYFFSWMMLFEYLDYHASLVLDRINDIFPKDMSDKEFEFILYKKIRGYIAKKKIRGKVQEIINTDPDLLEIEEMMRRISK
jgi:hypothetical protein